MRFVTISQQLRLVKNSLRFICGSVMAERLRALVYFDQQGVGSDPGRDTCYMKIWEVVLSALPARLPPYIGVTIQFHVLYKYVYFFC